MSANKPNTEDMDRYEGDLDWQFDADCRNSDSDLFMGPGRSNERKADKEFREEIAKKICRTCNVVEDCLEFALITKQPLGVWGGMTEDERRRNRRTWQAEQRKKRKTDQ